MLSLGAAAAAVALPPLALVTGPEPALAADLIQRVQRGELLTKLKTVLAGAVGENQNLIPALLRLAVNDALTYDKASKTGGANGSIRFPEELGRPENKGLEPALKFLEGVKAEVEEGWPGGPLSYADVIQFGATAAVKRTFINFAVEKAGGDYEKGLSLYQAIGSAGQWGYFDKQFGRADATEADPAGRIPDYAKASPAELKEAFERVKLKPRQIVVLSLFLSDDLVAFEEKLAADPEFKPWVEKYRKSRTTTSQNTYQVDLIEAFEKLSIAGAPINTEAYTYKETRKIRF